MNRKRASHSHFSVKKCMKWTNGLLLGKAATGFKADMLAEQLTALCNKGMMHIGRHSRSLRPWYFNVLVKNNMNMCAVYMRIQNRRRSYYAIAERYGKEMSF